MGKILLIDDENEMEIIIRGALKSEHQVTHVPNLKSAREIIKSQSFDLILLDIMFPEGNGFEFYSGLSEICDNPPPVLFLTSKAEVSDQALGFNLGADGYIIKPINSIILQARVNGIIKKHARLMPEVFINKDLKFVFPKQKAFICDSNIDSEIDLTAREYRLLLHFCRHEEQVFSREQLLDTVWGEVNVSDRAVDSHISHLRKKLVPSSFTIESVHGVGYRLIQTKDRTLE
jgi:DNA-binding response OmpR family regulator